MISSIPKSLYDEIEKDFTSACQELDQAVCNKRLLLPLCTALGSFTLAARPNFASAAYIHNADAWQLFLSDLNDQIQRIQQLAEENKKRPQIIAALRVAETTLQKIQSRLQPYRS